jgi:hypothetical protein
MKHAIIAALAVLALPALAEEVPGLGVALLFGETPRVEFQTVGAARPGATVTLILPDLSNPGDLHIGRATLGIALPASGIAGSGQVAFALSALPDAPSIGFALLGEPLGIAVIGGALKVDVTGDGVAETLSACLTIEAVQLQAVNEAGEAVWKDYVPLGYDVERTCP